MIKKLQENGFTVLGCGADSDDLLRWQMACGVVATSGTITGAPVSEEELIRDSLLREQQ